MASTPNLSLTLLEAAQSQKEVTVNDALYRIDTLLNSAVLDKDVGTPPTSPAEGAAYIVAASPTGDWAGKSKQIAYFQQIWRFIVPKAGLFVWVADEAKHYVFDGTNWHLANTTGGGGGGAGDMLKATYDAANIAQQLVGISASQTLTNKTMAMGSNTLSGTKAQFNTACTDGDFAYIGAANSFGAKQTLLAASTASASLNMPHGAAPTSPSDGDFWTTTAGLFGRINGSTVAYGTGGGGGGLALTGSFGSSGWCRFNDGTNSIMYQWGWYTNTTSISFPTSFPSACYGLLSNLFNTSGYPYAATSLSTTGATFAGATSITALYLAWGK